MPVLLPAVVIGRTAIGRLRILEGDVETENEGLAQLRALKVEGERRQLEALLSGEADALVAHRAHDLFFSE